MIFGLRKSARIASFATCFYLISYHVDAHCFHPDEKVDHTVAGCFPTTSPAPTESPAPSPSPSDFPTDTQKPSVSMSPSSSPTPAPTTSQPSSSPTESPTESPAPSPSPSDFPTIAPTTSSAPSMSPSESPSKSPTEVPSVSPTTSMPSDSPTSPILLTVVGVEFTIQNVTGEREMGPQNTRYFEKETTLYLRNQVEEAPGVTKIEVENVIVRDQKLVVQNIIAELSGDDPFLRKRRHLEEIQTNLVVTMDVVVSVLLDRDENLQLNVFFDEFLERPEHRNELQFKFEEEQFFAREIFMKGAISSSNASVKKASNSTAVTGIVIAVVALIVGSGLLWMWMQSRRVSNLQYDSGKIENLGTISRSFESDDRKASRSNVDRRMEIDYGDAQDQSSHGEFIDKDNEKNDRRSSLKSLMYIPTLMDTGSNIEVPDTPGTAAAVNGFATPASAMANGFANGFATPSSAMASGFATPSSAMANGLATPASANGFPTPSSKMSIKTRDFPTNPISKLLGQTSPSHTFSSEQILKDMASTKPRKLKIPLPPKSLGPLKSPFRRQVKTIDKIGNEGDNEYDISSMSGVGVVAGKNNVFDSNIFISNDRAKKGTKDAVRNARTQKVSRDIPPLEIGRPKAKPFEAKPTSVPVEEDLASRTSRTSRSHTSRRKKRHSTASRPYPPPMIGATDISVAKSTKTTKDHGVVDIVDEIAYLYSTNSEPERFKDSTLSS